MRISLISLLLFIAFNVVAGEADIVAVDVEHAGGNYFRFTVTVQHEDENWEHFAKAWEVLDMEGNLLGSRILRHPHINEQPFTRSQIIALPENVNQVTIRAYDLIHQFGGKELTIDIHKENDNEIN